MSMDASAGGPERVMAGFTLLEVLLAITLLALVAGMVTLGLRGPGRALEEAETLAEMDRETNRLLRRLHDDLAAVPRDAAGDFVAPQRTRAEGAGDVLECVTRAGVDLGDERELPRLVRLRYRLAEDPRQPGALLLYRAQQDWAPEREGQAEEQLLGRLLRRLTCSYQDEDGTLFSQWPPAVTAPAQEPATGDERERPLLPPAAIFCRVERWLDPVRGSSATFELAVRLPTGSGRLSSEGTLSSGSEAAPKIRYR